MDRSDNTGRSLVVVALPSEQDRVRKISSEPEPHLTLLYLGNDDYDASEIELISGYVEHAASMMSPFHLEVEGRGELGDKKADVLFFAKKWIKSVETFRNMLLQNDLVSKSYLSVEQFPDWIPHLTLGYPETPAKKIDEDDSFWYVDFNRIALWVDDYKGPTYKLAHPEYDMEVAMSQIERGRSAMSGYLSHYGIKGMKWGVRRSDAQLERAQSAPKPTLSEDAKTANKLYKKIETKGTGSLSNQEMRQFLERMDLENRYSRTMSEPQGKSAADRGHEQVKKYLAYGQTYENVRRFLETDTGKMVKTGMKTAAAAAAAYATGGTGPAAAAGAGVIVRRMTG